MADERSSRDVNFVPVIAGVKDTSGEISQIRVDETSQRLLVDSSESAFSTVGNGSVVILAKGDKYQLSTTSVPTARIFVQAGDSSTGPILIGSSTVGATLAARQGMAIYPTQGMWLRVSNLNKVYVTSETAGDFIHFYFEV